MSRKNANQKIVWPLTTKLIGIISTVVVLATIAVTAMASWFFASSLHSNAELNNLAAAENFAAQIKGEFEAIATSAKSFVSLGLRSGARIDRKSVV